jgi:4-hydroxy-4-methyl-2-oxoglutarate aldolase
MFIIQERINRCSPDLIKMFEEVEPATLGHVLHEGFMDYSLRCLVKGAKVVGPAITVRTAGADSTVVHKAMEIATKGDVVVVDRCGDMRHACWGGVVTLAASIRGVAGAIVDGLATDGEEIEKMGFPLYCRGISALTTKLLGYGGEINTVIQCGGVVVKPGDLIVADSNGIIVLDPEIAKPLGERALSMQQQEKEIIARLEGGEPLPKITPADSLILSKGRAAVK